MSAFKSRSNSLAGLTLDAVLGGEPVLPQQPPPPQQQSPPQKSSIVTTQTLFDIIREEYAQEGQKDRTTWQIFREKLRLKKSGSAWTSSLPIPTSDILLPKPKQRGVKIRPHSGIPRSDQGQQGMFTRGSSMRLASTKNPDVADVNLPGDGPPSRSFKPQLSRRDSVNQGDGEEDHRRRPPVVTFVEERQMSAREAIAAQETAEAAGFETSDEEDEEEEEGDDEENEEDDSREVDETISSDSAPKQTMSLFDLLGETDRQMGLTGSTYAMDDDEEYYEDEDDEEYEDDEDGGGGGEGELNCSVCDVKIKGASSSPCAHTFCKLCSKELSAQKGHCPVCSGFVLEFLEIF